MVPVSFRGAVDVEVAVDGPVSLHRPSLLVSGAPRSAGGR